MLRKFDYFIELFDGSLRSPFHVVLNPFPSQKFLPAEVASEFVFVVEDRVVAELPLGIEGAATNLAHHRLCFLTVNFEENF